MGVSKVSAFSQNALITLISIPATKLIMLISFPHVRIAAYYKYTANVQIMFVNWMPFDDVVVSLFM